MCLCLTVWQMEQALRRQRGAIGEMTTKDSSAPSRSWRRMLRIILVLSVPTILEQILSTLLQYVDTAMVGSAGRGGYSLCQCYDEYNLAGNSVPGAIGTAHPGADRQGGRLR